jgi:hypothetical protein
MVCAVRMSLKREANVTSKHALRPIECVRVKRRKRFAYRKEFYIDCTITLYGSSVLHAIREGDLRYEVEKEFVRPTPQRALRSASLVAFTRQQLSRVLQLPRVWCMPAASTAATSAPSPPLSLVLA